MYATSDNVPNGHRFASAKDSSKLMLPCVDLENITTIYLSPETKPTQLLNRSLLNFYTDFDSSHTNQQFVVVW